MTLSRLLMGFLLNLIGLVVRVVACGAILGVLAVSAWRHGNYAYARGLCVGVEGLGSIRYVRLSKNKPPDGVPDYAGLCVTAVADLSAGAPMAPPLAMSEIPGDRRQFGGQWQPTPMPRDLGGLSSACSVLWPGDMKARADRALAEPGSYWASVPRERGRVDDQWSLYAPKWGIVAWAKAGSEG